jgi:large subunit ribosomal protein L23
LWYQFRSKVLVIVSKKTTPLKLSTQNLVISQITPSAIDYIGDLLWLILQIFSLSNAQIVKYPIITDKATRLLENNQYSFVVDRYSDKTRIKAAIEYLFNVKVVKITCRLPRKKNVLVNILVGNHNIKAIVTLFEGDVINLFTDS